MRRRICVAVGLGVLAAAVAVLATSLATRRDGVETAEPAAGARDGRTTAAPPMPILEGNARAGRERAAPAAPGGGAQGGAPSGAGSSSRVAGQVVDADGKPVAGALVRLAAASDSNATTVTDAEGRFAFERPAGGPAVVVITAPGFAERSVPATEVTPETGLRLSKGWTISGRLRDGATREAVVGVAVAARPATSPDDPTAEAATWREDGTFLVAVPWPGTYVLDVGERFVGSLTPASEWIPTRVEGVPAGAADVEVVVTRGLSIEGSVVDDAGEPLSRPAMVEAVGRTASGDPDYTVRKSVLLVEGGALRVPGLRAGRYDLWVRPSPSPDDAKGAAVSATVVRDVEAGMRGLTVRLSRGLVLAGRLEDVPGALVTGRGYVYVYRQGEMGRGHPVIGEVPGDGTFRAGPLDGAFLYDVLASGFSGRRQGTTTGVSPRDASVVVLPSAGRIAGRVVTEDGKPVPAGVPIGVVGEGSDPRAAGVRLFGYSTAQGAFVVDGLADVTFSVEAGGGRSGYLGALVAGVKPGTTDLVLTVSVGVELSGTLVDVAGAPVSTTSLQADDGARMAAMRPYAQVGSDGKFLLRGLRAGRVRLSLLQGQSWITAGEVEAPGADLRVVVPSR